MRTLPPWAIRRGVESHPDERRPHRRRRRLYGHRCRRFRFATRNTGGTGPDIVRLTDPGSAGLPVSGGVSTGNYFINQNYSTSSTTTPGSLKEALSGAVSANTITVDTTGVTSGAQLALGTNVLTINNGGGFVFDDANPYAITASGRGGITSGTSGGNIIFNNFATSGVTISAPILANGASTATFAGTGTTILGGVNTYTGNTTIGTGTTLSIGGSGQLGSAGTYAATITNNGTFNYNSSVTQTLTGVLTERAG